MAGQRVHLAYYPTMDTTFALLALMHLHSARMAARKLAADHSLSLMDAEIAWTDRAVRQIGNRGQAQASDRYAAAPAGRRAKIAV